MNGIVIDINPTLVHLGHFDIRWYSIFILLAVVAAVLISVREVKKKGLSPDLIYSIAPWLLIAGILGARLFHVIDQWSFYSQNPGLILQMQLGGLAIYGALFGGAAALFVYTRVKRIALPVLLDALVPGLLVAQMIGRLGCIIDGDAYAAPTSLPWGFIYVNPGAMVPSQLAGIPIHPYPVYDMLWNGLSLVLLLTLRKRIKQDGFLFLAYVALYSVGRFMLTFVRQENQWFWGLQEAQVIALLTLAAAATVYAVTLLRRNNRQKSSLEYVS